MGGAVPASVLWEILKNQGLETPFEGFLPFQEALTARAGKVRNLDDFLGRYFHITEAIQSSPDAVATSAYQAVAKAFRRGGVTHMELRFNPVKRLRKGLHSMDAILLSALQGLEKASAHYQVSTALILSLGRDIPQVDNARIVEAAIRWGTKSARGLAAGIVAIDMAGPESGGKEKDPRWMEETAELFANAKAAGLKATYHIGETNHSGWRDTQKVLHTIRPHRIGHGIQIDKAPLREKKAILEVLKATGTCLEICPTVNMLCKGATLKGLRLFCRELACEGVAFATATDNPYLAHTNVERELQLLGDPDLSRWATDCGWTHRFGPWEKTDQNG